MRHAFRFGTIGVVAFFALGVAYSQTIRVPAPRRPAAMTVPTNPSAIPVGNPQGADAAHAAQIKPTAPSNLGITGGDGSEVELTWDPSTEKDGVISLYTVFISTDKIKCVPQNVNGIESSMTNSAKVPGRRGQALNVCLQATDAKGNSSDFSDVISVQIATAVHSCWPIPVRPFCTDFGLTKDDRESRISSNINAFYRTTNSYSFFNQIKSIYNNASGSATISADLATLNFRDGMQIVVTTNAQAGSSGAAASSVGPLPTLSANGAGQAAQNAIYGGTFVVSEIYPLIAAGPSKWDSVGHLGVIVDMALKEGADIQNFKSGTNVNVSSPPFHGSGQLEGYLQYNSINLAPNSEHYAGSIFLGGSYGYGYMSHGYARDYGFGTKINNRIGQISFGILLNGVAKITVSRAFGPSQTYIDSTTMATTTVNNFKAWSFGIAYQSAAPAK